tara:strand:+ start:18169 stop:19722 length:1554 start_codon:yes stop_codon:yes gene_type:complete
MNSCRANIRHYHATADVARTANHENHLRVSEIVQHARRYTNELLPIVQIALVFLPLIALVAGGIYHAIALSMLCLGVGLNLTAWCRSRYATLPLILLISLQDLLWYGTPLLVDHKSLHEYADIMILRSGVCLLLYLASMTIARRSIQQRMSPIHRRTLALDLSEQNVSGALKNVLLGGLAICCILEWMFVTGAIWPYLSKLPNGSLNVIRTALAAGECGAGFLFAFQWGRGTLPTNSRVLIVFLLVAIITARAASILLSSTVAFIGAILLGAYLGSGRVPWRAITITVLLLGFLNLGKFDMRGRYWNSPNQTISLSTIPDYFSEWASASGSKLFASSNSDRFTSATGDRGQSLTERLSNIQILLYVDRAVYQRGYSLLLGETYRASWHVLVPRVFWPNKPRSHIGQEILNVHYDRQTRAETFRTYIAWGLVPEAVGNFGLWGGSIFLGVLLGSSLGWVEQYTSNLPLFSLPSILACFLMISLTGSSGMVAGVWVASMLQISLILCVGLYPFMRWVRV